MVISVRLLSNEFEKCLSYLLRMISIPFKNFSTRMFYTVTQVTNSSDDNLLSPSK